jgi:hypothetical protein
MSRAAPSEEFQPLGKAHARPISNVGETKMEKLNTEKQELNIEDLDAASGGAIFIQSPILTAVALAVAISAGIYRVLHPTFR